ncbi:MAG: hypothetical protein NZ730_11410, partial [Porticoccaceae bacterium]|nr:hypothetical protein [Porticoccaceae bacterium]
IKAEKPSPRTGEPSPDTGIYYIIDRGETVEIFYNPDINRLEDLSQSQCSYKGNWHNLDIGLATKFNVPPKTVFITDLDPGIIQPLREIIRGNKQRNKETEEQSSSESTESSHTKGQKKPGMKCKVCQKMMPADMDDIHNHMLRHIRKEKRRSRIRLHSSKNVPPASTSSSDDSPARTKKGNRKESDLNTVIPETLNDPDCPETTKQFFNMKAQTGQGYKRYVAPHFPEAIKNLETDLDFRDIPDREFKAWANTYNKYVERSAMDYQRDRKIKIQIYNTVTGLQQGGKRDSAAALKNNSPVLATHNMQELTLQSITEFFESGRAYCFQSAIEWTDFFPFCITPRTVGESIYKKVQARLASKPDLTPTATTISTYIEKIILDLLPTQANYSDRVEEIVALHQSHLTAANPSADYTKQNIQGHGSELQYLHSTYLQAIGQRGEWTKEESARLVNIINDQLQNKIINDTKWKTALKKMYVTRGKNYDQIPRQEVLNDLGKVIEAENDDQHQAAATMHPPKAQKNRNPPRAKTPPAHPATQTSRETNETNDEIPIHKRQKKCDICTKAEIACKGKPAHCKRRSHQNPFVPRNNPAKMTWPTNETVRRAKAGEKVQISYKECLKCHNYRENGAEPPETYSAQIQRGWPTNYQQQPYSEYRGHVSENQPISILRNPDRNYSRPQDRPTPYWTNSRTNQPQDGPAPRRDNNQHRPYPPQTPPAWRNQQPNQPPVSQNQPSQHQQKTHQNQSTYQQQINQSQQMIDQSLRNMQLNQQAHYQRNHPEQNRPRQYPPNQHNQRPNPAEGGRQ